ncbi:MAG TPA: hypothetical protein VFI46_17675 [Jiangellaceae bacterium]|nr:hypothetical protein [Jiangellaceae bacterium]
MVTWPESDSGLGRRANVDRDLGTAYQEAIPWSHVPTDEPARHSWTDLLTLVGTIRSIAFDRSLPPIEAMGQIRDEFRVYDGESFD